MPCTQWCRDTLQHQAGPEAYGRAGLRSVVVKKYNHHANHGSIPDDKVNILKRDFGTETINQNGAQILPTSMCRKKDGLIWRLSWICAAVKSSAMPMAHI